jgi:hypothetical protein
MTLMYYVLIAEGIDFNYPIPEESMSSCKGTDPTTWSMMWMVYVPGIKCRLWVIVVAYFVINVKPKDDIFQGISKLDYLIKVSVF